MNKSIDSGDSFRFSSKGETLERLSYLVETADFCDQLVFDASEWSNKRSRIISQIIDRFGSDLLAVRSSSSREDGVGYSSAGAYLSCINVEPAAEAIGDAVDSVFSSYDHLSETEQVLIQPMVKDVVVSGVVLTRDLDSGGPYFVLNYDDFSGRTDTVTGGAESKTVLVRRSRTETLRSPRFRQLINCVVELETITGCHELDIEFCITVTNKIYILQVRRLTTAHHWEICSDDAIDSAINNIHIQLSDTMKPHPELAGRSTILGEMPDWNPAEMIGDTPRPLAISLYKLLITDRVWSEGRARMGYRHVNQPLLLDLCGRPYIDVRLSLNSFLPAETDKDLSECLINYQLQLLSERRELHDKIEFDVATTCRDFSFEQSAKRMRSFGISSSDLHNFEIALARITQSALNAGRSGIASLVQQSNQLLIRSPNYDAPRSTEGIQTILTDCIALGTLPFSQLARHGFIGTLFLKSLVERDALTQDDADRFMQGVQTISAALIADMHKVALGEKSMNVFLAKYGHLRPSTYDVLSWRYDEKPDLFFGATGNRIPQMRESFQPSEKQITAIGKLLREYKYDLSPQELLSYIAAAIKGREQSKFAFSRSLSNALSALTKWGDRMGLSREDVSFLPIDSVFKNMKIESLKSTIQKEREAYKLTQGIRLPSLICEPSEINVVQLPLCQPTFITSKKVTAKTIHLTAEINPHLDGFIVLIKNADPGYDWIFSHQIAGLVTQFGGTNSHMAIRCSEFGLPAAIGCGERLFNLLAKSPVIELNCAARKISLQ